MVFRDQEGLGRILEESEKGPISRRILEGSWKDQKGPGKGPGKDPRKGPGKGAGRVKEGSWQGSWEGSGSVWDRKYGRVQERSD